MGCFMQASASYEYGADGIDEVTHGIDVGGHVSPLGHGARGGEKSREQHDAYHKEPHDEHGLLHGVGVVGHDKSERREEQRQKHGKHVDEPQRPCRRDAIDYPRQQQTHGDDKQRDEPVRDEFGEDERPLGDRGDVDLFDGAGLFLANDVECGQKARHQHHYNGKKRRNHEEFIVLLFIVER